MKSVGIALFAATILHAEITINDIDKLVNDIKQERVGLTDKEIVNAKDPFIYPNGKYAKALHGNRSKKRRYRFVLTAIVNNHVKINRRWYSLNSKVNGFTVSKVGKNYVLLTRNGERTRVFLKRQKSKKIKLLVK
ncbi:hypothetical protein [Hydrogenimonas cancrithermarum]|nr:hypothetical protein [Hydrogenimonas cancrithermarum]